MIELSKPITDAEIEAAAAYFSALQPRKRMKVIKVLYCFDQNNDDSKC
jgi:hypothetical protein